MHGGDIYRNQIHMDFSININPLGLPKCVDNMWKDALQELEHYPDITCMKLKEALADSIAVPKSQILCGNGASELILAVCHALQTKRALLVAPGFHGYEVALQAVGAEISYHFLQEDKDFRLDESVLAQMEKQRPELVFVCNPNNPTGQLVDRTLLEQIAIFCQRVGATLVVDECFLELACCEEERNERSMIPWMSAGGVARRRSDARDEKAAHRMTTGAPVNAGGQLQMVVLRAFTKTYAVPGLRLGYAVCSSTALAEQIGMHLAEWNISQMTQNIGVALLQEKEYVNKALAVLEEERKFLRKRLEQLGVRVFPSDTNFLLLQETRLPLYEVLLERGILIRNCNDYVGLTDGFYRIAVRTRSENEALLAALQDILAT